MLGYNPEYGNNSISARTLITACNNELTSSLFAYSYSWGNLEKVEIVAKSSYEFKDEWFDDSPMEDINYALKKWNKEQMTKFITKCENLIETFGGDYGIQ